MARSFLCGPGSFTQPSGQTALSLTFGRPLATTDLNGSPLADGTGASLMRGWNHKRLLCGAWDSTNNKPVNVCPMLWYGASMDETTGRTATQVKSELQTLAMLFERTVVTPPG